MAVITQSYDIDLKPDAARPVVEISQYDTGSRAIVFTVYDGSELANLTGCTARVDGSRSDGADFSVSCTVGTGSKVSFTINQEMTSVPGLHSAELVIIGADGKPLGTQNFVVHVEQSPMNRATAASPDDRTLYDQFTGSVSKTVADKMAAVDNKMTNIDTQITTTVDKKIDSRITPDPLLGAWCACTVDGDTELDGDGKAINFPLKMKSKSDGAEKIFDVDTVVTIKKPGVYHLFLDGWYRGSSEKATARNTSALLSEYDADYHLVNERRWEIYSSQGIGAEGAWTQLFRGGITFYVPDDGKPHYLSLITAGTSVSTLSESDSPQIVITRISSGSNIVKTVVTQKEDGTPVTAGSATAQGNALDELYTVSKQ